MLKRHHLVRSTLAVAMLSAAVLAQPAHAGPLGGIGSGGLTGGLSGGFGPRGMDVGGNAAGQITRNGTALPRPDKATQKADGAARPSAATTTAAAGASATSAGQAATAAQSTTTRSGSTAADAAAQGSASR